MTTEFGNVNSTSSETNKKYFNSFEIKTEIEFDPFYVMATNKKRRKMVPKSDRFQMIFEACSKATEVLGPNRGNVLLFFVIFVSKC